MNAASASPPARLLQRLEALRSSHGAVVFDAHDPNRPIIEAVAHQLGMPAYPSEEVPPRTIRGCAPTADAGPFVADRRQTAAIVADVMRRTVARRGRLTPAGFAAELAEAGWALTPAVRPL